MKNRYTDVIQQLTWDYLWEKATDHGASKIKVVCNDFLKFKGTVGTEPEKRKPQPKQWIDQAFIRQGGICNRCNEPMDLQAKEDTEKVTGDHIISLQQGGKNTKRNCCAVHKRCNSAKGANTLFTESKLMGRTVLDQIRNTELIEPEEPHGTTKTLTSNQKDKGDIGEERTEPRQ